VIRPNEEVKSENVCVNVSVTFYFSETIYIPLVTWWRMAILLSFFPLFFLNKKEDRAEKGEMTRE
jgi:hypothetical protein